MGSLFTLLLTLLLSFPIGVAAAIYLEEFAHKNRWTDLIEVNINNLAAVPSIVFGLLGLAVFIGFFGLPRSAPLVGALVLTLLTLPTIIIASRAALKGVPPSIREAALGMGASKIQMVAHHVLPLAMPGMLTGTIIGMARALGETAPLLMIGMVAFIVDVPERLHRPGHGAAGAGLPVGRQPGARLRRAHLGRDHRAAGVPRRDERGGRHSAQPIREALVARAAYESELSMDSARDRIRDASDDVARRRPQPEAERAPAQRPSTRGSRSTASGERADRRHGHGGEPGVLTAATSTSTTARSTPSSNVSIDIGARRRCWR